MNTTAPSLAILSIKPPSPPVTTLSVVMPVCGDPSRLDSIISHLSGLASRLAQHWEIILVDYGPDARRWQACPQPGNRSRIRRFRLLNRQGFDKALEFGRSKAGGTIVLTAVPEAAHRPGDNNGSAPKTAPRHNGHPRPTTRATNRRCLRDLVPSTTHH